MTPTVICVVGPTATGKTKMGVALARHYGGEVVSCDSMQIYRGMQIGTAAPTAEEMQGVAHHMVGIAAPTEDWSVARYVQAADACVQEILSRGKLPVIVGGTGLWLDALIAGGEFAAGTSGGAVRRTLLNRLSDEGSESLRAELHRIDPAAYERIEAADEKRLVRALEVYYETGKTITAHNEHSKNRPPRYHAFYIGLTFAERAQLYARIDARVDTMVAQGLLQEIHSLLQSGLPRTATAWQAIGYRQFLAVADGAMTEAEAIEEVKLRSRQYAKRQLTWLRRNEKIHWIAWEKSPDFPVGFSDATKYLADCGLR